jgi:hypothetical protein
MMGGKQTVRFRPFSDIPGHYKTLAPIWGFPMPIWLLALMPIVASFLAWRGLKNGGFYVAGEKADTPIVIAAAAIIAIAWGLAVAMHLGFIPDHAP